MEMITLPLPKQGQGDNTNKLYNREVNKINLYIKERVLDAANYAYLFEYALALIRITKITAWSNQSNLPKDIITITVSISIKIEIKSAALIAIFFFDVAMPAAHRTRPKPKSISDQGINNGAPSVEGESFNI